MTLEGWQVWDLAQQLGGQLRAIPGAVLGWDMGAAPVTAAALCVPARAAAELPPVIEAAMGLKMNLQMEERQGDAVMQGAS